MKQIFWGLIIVEKCVMYVIIVAALSLPAVPRKAKVRCRIKVIYFPGSNYFIKMCYTDYYCGSPGPSQLSTERLRVDAALKLFRILSTTSYCKEKKSITVGNEHNHFHSTIFSLLMFLTFY